MCPQRDEPVMKWYVYLLKCSDDSIYTGYTHDLENRLSTHNQGKGAKYTRSRLPVVLLHREEFDLKSDALKRECAIKKMSRRQKMTLVDSA